VSSAAAMWRPAQRAARRGCISCLQNPALQLQERRRKRNFSLPPHRVFTLRDQQRDQSRREGRPDVVSAGNQEFSRLSGGTGNCLPDRCPRSSGEGGKAGRRSGRTPCLPDRLPAWVPVTVSHRSGSRGAPPQRAEPRSTPFRAWEWERRQGSTPRYRAGHDPLPGGSTGVEGPLYRAGPVVHPPPGTADRCVGRRSGCRCRGVGKDRVTRCRRAG
jgi:hypothetical protein